MRQKSAAVAAPPPARRSISARTGASNGTKQNSSCSAFVSRLQPVMRTNAASTPSADVPDMKPITSREGLFIKVKIGCSMDDLQFVI